MFNKNIKLVLAVIILAWAVYEFTKGHIMNGISIVLLAGIFVFFYFKNEILLLTLFKLRESRISKAETNCSIKLRTHPQRFDQETRRIL